jgi:hypothetical protein
VTYRRYAVECLIVRTMCESAIKPAKPETSALSSSPSEGDCVDSNANYGVVARLLLVNSIVPCAVLYTRYKQSCYPQPISICFYINCFGRNPAKWKRQPTKPVPKNRANNSPLLIYSLFERSRSVRRVASGQLFHDIRYVY